MPVTVRGTDILFNDGSTQNTAAITANTTNVLNATAAASVGAVGTYAFLANATAFAGVYAPGSTVAGSSLRYAGGNSQSNGTAGTNSISGTAPAGTWRCMGNVTFWNDYSGSGRFGSVFLRIS